MKGVEILRESPVWRSFHARPKERDEMTPVLDSSCALNHLIVAIKTIRSFVAKPFCWEHPVQHQRLSGNHRQPEAMLATSYTKWFGKLLEIPTLVPRSFVCWLTSLTVDAGYIYHIYCICCNRQTRDIWYMALSENRVALCIHWWITFVCLFKQPLRLHLMFRHTLNYHV